MGTWAPSDTAAAWRPRHEKAPKADVGRAVEKAACGLMPPTARLRLLRFGQPRCRHCWRAAQRPLQRRLRRDFGLGCAAEPAGWGWHRRRTLHRCMQQLAGNFSALVAERHRVAVGCTHSSNEIMRRTAAVSGPTASGTSDDLVSASNQALHWPREGRWKRRHMALQRRPQPGLRGDLRAAGHAEALNRQPCREHRRYRRSMARRGALLADI
mmetsp:Transcript_67932/g.196733  ORF Transcript_67932/g.196733 Transcript_67932/m.196733 type:complete len:212 (-) Transcript_67932:1333-1968(-)